MSQHEGPFSASFLWESIDRWPVFIPEELDNEQKELAKLARGFDKNEVEPMREKIEAKEPGVTPRLLKKAGELGLLMAEIPEAYGGLGLNKVTATVIAENVIGWSSFAVPFLCHTGIGTLPIMYYGTEAQKKKYLSKLATGEMIGAYALTEAGSGSDALAAKTRAVLSSDGKNYILNGEKQFITNGGFADLFTVFAKINGDQFTAFIVERNFSGVSVGKEEKKLGIHGSSTTSLILQEAQVPVENVLGEIGKGHRIAFNVLNVGRWKLGCGCMGCCKRLMEYATKYVKERQQFGKPLASFQAIREKIAQCAIRTYLAESVVYRYADTLDRACGLLDKSAPDYFFKVLKKIKGLNIEASIAKVFGSEAIATVADETVQMYGGYGFIRDYPPEQFYRDVRINRIYEGTNEINRLLIPDTIMRRALKGSIDLMGVLQTILANLKTGFPKTDPATPMAPWVDQVESLKRLTIYFSGVAAQKYMEKLREKQSLVMTLADLVIETYAMESGIIRAIKIEKLFGAERAKLPQMMVETYIAEKLPDLLNRVRLALYNIAEGNEAEFTSYQKALARLVEPKVALTEDFKEQIAVRVLEKEAFAL